MLTSVSRVNKLQLICRLPQIHRCHLVGLLQPSCMIIVIQRLYCNKKTSIDVKIKELNYNIALETLSRSYVLTMPPFPQFVTNTSTQKCQNIFQLCALFSSLRQKEKQTYLYVFCFKIFPSNLIYFARLFIMSRLLYRL